MLVGKATSRRGRRRVGKTTSGWEEREKGMEGDDPGRVENKKLCAFSTARGKNQDGVPGKAGMHCPCES